MTRTGWTFALVFALSHPVVCQLDSGRTEPQGTEALDSQSSDEGGNSTILAWILAVPPTLLSVWTLWLAWKWNRKINRSAKEQDAEEAKSREDKERGDMSLLKEVRYVAKHIFNSSA
eukprot:737330-Prorocentrum_minimum.AAC.2